MREQSINDHRLAIHTLRSVEALLHPRAMGGVLAQALGGPTLARTLRTAPCRVLDARYEPGAACTILYQLGEEMVIGALRWPGADPLPLTEPGSSPAHRSPSVPEQLSSDLRVYPFAQDPTLPSLARVLDAQAMVAVLNRTLPLCQAGLLKVLHCRVTPLRYRPGRRCTLRFDLGVRNLATQQVQRQTLFGKLYHNASKAAAVYEEMQLLSTAVPQTSGQLQLAPAVAFVPELPLVLQAPVCGLPLDLLLSQPERLEHPEQSRAWQGVQRAASALAALHGVTITTSRLRPVAAELKKIQQRITPVASIASSLGEQMAALLDRLAPGLQRATHSRVNLTLIHGDCKPSQFLLNAQQMVLLDFDHCGMADPAADVGVFLASLRQLATAQALKTGQRCDWLITLEEHFLATYLSERAGDEDFAWRAGWYQAIALLRKAQRSFARSPRSPLPAVLVAEGLRCTLR